MICKHCHKKNNYNHKYCFYCGELLNEESEESGKHQLSVDASPSRGHSNAGLDNNTKDVNDKTVETAETNLAYTSSFDETSKEPEPEPEPSRLTDDQNNYYKDFLFNVDQPDDTESSRKNFIPILVGLLVVIGCVILVIKFNPLTWLTSAKANEPNDVVVTYNIEPTQIKSGAEAQEIIIYAPDAESVTLLEQPAPIVNGQADFVITNAVIEKMAQIKEGKFTLDATIYDHNGNQTQKQIVLPSFLAPADFTLLYPDNLSVQVQEAVIDFKAQLTTASTILINDENYTEQIGDDGIITVSLPVDTTQAETIYDIKVEQPDKTAINKTLTITYDVVMEDILFDFDLSSPIVMDPSTTSFTLTGKTAPSTNITSPMDEIKEITVNPDGSFSITVEPIHTGYNLLNLSFSLPTSKVVEKSMIVDYTPSLDDYVRSAWAPDPYEYLTKIKDAHNGEHFVLTGVITNVISKENGKSKFLLALESNKNEIYYVEYWGDFPYKANDLVKVFGNKWGLKENYPFVLCKKIK